MIDNFHNVTVVITRDEYDIPPENYLVNDDYNGHCDIMIDQLFFEMVSTNLKRFELVRT